MAGIMRLSRPFLAAGAGTPIRPGMSSLSPSQILIRPRNFNTTAARTAGPPSRNGSARRQTAKKMANVEVGSDASFLLPSTDTSPLFASPLSPHIPPLFACLLQLNYSS